MKLRFGFVSNSSSTSFFVIFPKEIKSKADIAGLVPKWAEKPIADGAIRDGGISTNYIKEIFEAIEDLEKLGKGADIVETIFSEVLLFDISGEVAKLIKDNPNTFIYYFNYGNEGGKMSDRLEHGDVFYDLPHVSINNH